jgi:hypothetical protein
MSGIPPNLYIQGPLANRRKIMFDNSPEQLTKIVQDAFVAALDKNHGFRQGSYDPEGDAIEVIQKDEHRYAVRVEITGFKIEADVEVHTYSNYASVVTCIVCLCTFEPGNHRYFYPHSWDSRYVDLPMETVG